MAIHFDALWFQLKKPLSWLINNLSRMSGRVNILFVVSNEIGFRNQAPIIRKLACNPNFNIATYRDSVDKSGISNAALRDLCNNISLTHHQARRKKWDYIFVTDIVSFSPRWNTIFVMQSHGSSIGNQPSNRPDWSLKQAASSKADIIFLSNIAQCHHLLRMRPDIVRDPSKLCLLTGSPMARGAKGESELSDSVGSHAPPNILLSSHFTPMSVLRTNGVGIIERVSAEFPDAKVTITAHPRLWSIESPSFDGTQFRRLVEETCARLDNVTFFATGSPEDLFASADILLCDYSSILVEFARHKKPIVLLLPPNFHFKSAVTERFYLSSSFPAFSEIDAMRRIREGLADPQRYSEQQNALIEYFVFDPDNSVERITQFITECGKIDKVGAKHWREVRTKLGQNEQMLAAIIQSYIQKNPEIKTIAAKINETDK